MIIQLERGFSSVYACACVCVSENNMRAEEILVASLTTDLKSACVPVENVSLVVCLVL